MGADSDPHSPAQKQMDVAYTIPRFASPDCLEEVLSICGKEKIHAVIPIINLAVEFLDLHRDAFQKLRMKLLVNDNETIQICHDKLALTQFCQRKRIGVPEIYNSKDNDLPFPLIAKPRRGEGGKNCMVLNDFQDLAYCRNKYPNHIFQRFMQGYEFSTDWYSDLTGNPHVVVPRERLFVRAGEVMVSRIRLHPIVVAAVTRLGKALKLLGPCTIQGFLDADESFYLTDVNLRFGSGFIHTIAAGADVPFLIYKELLGQRVPNIDSITDGLMMSRFSEGFYYEGDE